MPIISQFIQSQFVYSNLFLVIRLNCIVFATDGGVSSWVARTSSLEELAALDMSTVQK